MQHFEALSVVSCLLIEDPLEHRIIQAQKLDDWVKAIRTIAECCSYKDFLHDILYKDPDKEIIVLSSWSKR